MFLSIATKAKPNHCETPSVEKHAHPPRAVYCATFSTLLTSPTTKLEMCVSIHKGGRAPLPLEPRRNRWAAYKCLLQSGTSEWNHVDKQRNFVIPEYKIYSFGTARYKSTKKQLLRYNFVM